MRHLFCTGLLSVLLASCSALEIETEFAAGRQALLAGNAGGALQNFNRVSSGNPQYATSYAVIPQSVWTYTGRAHYDNAQYKEAKAALVRALTSRGDDPIARLYHGMTLVRLPAASAQGFASKEIVFALNEGIEPERLITLMRKRGVAFDIDKSIEPELRKAGASQALLDAARNIRATQSASSGQDFELAKRELASGFKGLLAALDYTVNQTNEGRFWDPNGAIRKQLQTGLELVNQPQPDWEQILATGEWVGKRLEEEIDIARRNESEDQRRRSGR